MVGGRKRVAAQKGSSRGGEKDAVPQRHRTAGFAAVVVKGRKRDAAQKGCGRGAGEMPFHNGRELRVLLPLWYRG